MRKEIKDLTVEEKQIICDTYYDDNSACENCPLCLGLDDNANYLCIYAQAKKEVGFDDRVVTPELKAIRELRKQGTYYSKEGIEISSLVQHNLDIIETALERIPKLEKENKQHNLNTEEINKFYEKKLEKLEKALDTIREKCVLIYVFKHCISLYEYNLNINEKYQLTQEEYDLLKEVLE